VSESQWFVVQTNPREEQLASTVLTQHGVAVYQPYMEKFVFHARKKTLKRYPLFPGYLFVHIRPVEEDFHKVRWSRGVRKILIDNYQPVSIQDEFVTSLMNLQDKETGVIKKPVEFTAGELVRIRSGPLKDIVGIFEEWGSDEGRVRILIEMVNNRAKVLVHPSIIEKA